MTTEDTISPPELEVLDHLRRAILSSVNERNALRQQVAAMKLDLVVKAKAVPPALEEVQAEVKRLLGELKKSNEARVAVLKGYGEMTQLADDALRSLQNDDQSGAMACLREALSDALNDIECGLAAADKPDASTDWLGVPLKTCPCCGGEARRYKDGDGPSWGYAVKCVACNLKTLVDLKDRFKGIRLWQERVTHDSE